MSDKLIKQAKPLGPIADFMGFLGGALNLASINVPGPEIRDYNAFKTEMESYLSKIFTATEKLLRETVVAVFGEGNSDEANDPEKLREILGVMSARGRTEIDSKSSQPIAEL